MSYSQFIHGKTSGGRTYQPVAHTPDLADRRDELETIARRYRFWGSQPPVDKPIAVGIFRYRDTLLLAQAMQAMRGNGRPAADAQGRPFTQHRYVFIPPGSLGDLRGRWWLLLNWVMEETGGIPTFTRPEPALAPLAAPRFDAPRDPAAGSLDRLARSLRLADAQGRPVLLSALAALVNRKRVIFDAAATHDVFSEDLLEGMLLLLPAVCREQVAVAAGALDETICTRADLMVKTNGPPAGPLSPDLIWARRANNRFLGAAGPTTPANEYTDLLRPIVARPESHPMLVQILDGIDSLAGSGHSTPWPLLNNGWLATRLIPALPDPKIRAEYWQSALSRLSPDEWQATLPAILDETGLEIAWAELQQQIKRRPETFAPLVFQLWQNFSRAYIRYALQEELPADLTLAEILLRYGLAGQLGPEHRADLFALSLAVIEALGGQNRRRAAELADFILQRGPFNVPAEQFALHNAALSGN
ncbi:MAG: hypothetical protein ACE5G8_15515, partial [Anaerolineae bacterium]